MKLSHDHGACPNLPSGSWSQAHRATTQRTALRETCIWKSGEIGETVKLLLKFRANPNQVAKLQSNPMNAYEMACRKNNKQAIEQLETVTPPEICIGHIFVVGWP